ncbi:chitin synthase-domain-containing protein [Phlyctochytrium arcticum]|nr:chitin synthase-domain-containing protein [Phlyctochytrium arcticum]
MLRNQQDQSVVLAGEAGSGKSETRKLLVRQLIALSRNAKKKSKVHSGVIKTETVLDAFGTARTLLNPHSSRFSRYTEYQYDDRGKMVGAKMLDYLLEKNRVCHAPTDERNFHIFYFLLGGATPEEKTQWRLHDAGHFAYLSTPRPGRVTTEDQIKFGELRDHLKSLGVGRRLQAQIYQLMAAILHLGNITFQDDPERPQEACVVKNREALEIAAELLGVSARTLEGTLTLRTKLVYRDVVTVFLNADDAITQRDSLATSLYSLVFSWLIEHINTRLCQDDCATFIGVVDVTGFQDTNHNGFEHFLGNFASERLQQFVNRRILESHEEYVREGIRSASVPQGDNTPLVEFMAGEAGVLRILDNNSVEKPVSRYHQQKEEETAPVPLIEQLTASLETNPLFAPGTTTPSAFGVKHYSRTVEYDTTDFLVKNKDDLCPDFVSIFRGNGKDIPSSANGFVRDLFSEKSGVSAETGGRDHGTVTGAHAPMKPIRQPSLKRKGGRYGNEKSSAPNTVAYNFKTAIDEMIETLTETIPWFIMCIKPNPDLSSDKFETKRVSQQLRGLGITQIAQARSAADYTADYPIDEFLSRYRVIVDPIGLDESAGPSGKCEDFVLQSNWTNKEMAVGRTKVFLSEASWRSLEDELRTVEDQLRAERKTRGRQKSGLGLSRKNSSKTLTDADNAGDETLIEEEETSSARKKWVCCTWCLTWYVFPVCMSCCGMKRKDIQMAWREKLALCIVIFFLCSCLLFFIVGLGRIICPRINVLSTTELAGRTDMKEPWVYAYGRAYMIKPLVTRHLDFNVQDYQVAELFGQDVSFLFNKTMSFEKYCPGVQPPVASWDNLANRRPIPFNMHAHSATQQVADGSRVPRPYLENMAQYAKSRVAWSMDDVGRANSGKRLIVLNDNVYDVTAYYNGPPLFGADAAIDRIFGGFTGKDATAEWNRLIRSPNPATSKTYLNCMNNMFFIGVVDHRNDIKCRFSNYVLLAATIVLVAVIGFKFLAALQFTAAKEPEEHDKFVICQVPCYTEGAESLTKTLESLASLRYDDKRKLLFVICDGMIIGSGNDRPTPRIVLDILGVDPNVDPDPVSFQSLGIGDNQHNMGKVYSGLYEFQGHSVPYIVVVKVGKATERSRPGNRGKRDSQMILMRYLSRVHFNAEMNPLELELYHHMKNVIGVNPSFYEYVLMVDADTEVYQDSLNKMVSAMIHDSKIMGLCGETLLANEKASWTSMIQVYEYFISHHLAKAFESLFGSVTCLPGCFCMYRVRTPTKNVPLLIAPSVIADYSENRVDTLHMKNLLHLGEDRYLTTLMMKHFPHLKTSFTNDAQCRTNAPDQWSVLLSQRRRWINSTVHNLLELAFLPQLCGFCCFSMRFVVMLDLFSTLVQPVLVLYLGYLIYSATSDDEIFPTMSLILLGAIYGLQVIIFVLKRQWAQIGWMIVYILALPVFSLYIPLYAFWHFDDFSWGNTRVVIGEKGKKMVYAADVGVYDPKVIPMKKWSDYETHENWEKGSQASRDSRASDFSDRSGPGGPGSVYGGSTYTPNTPTHLPPYPSPKANRLSHISVGSYAPGSPSDEDLLRETRRVLATANLMTVTKKQVRDELSAVFNVDLTSRKQVINGFIEDILQGRL